VFGVQRVVGACGSLDINGAIQERLIVVEWMVVVVGLALPRLLGWICVLVGWSVLAAVHVAEGSTICNGEGGSCSSVCMLWVVWWQRALGLIGAWISGAGVVVWSGAGEVSWFADWWGCVRRCGCRVSCIIIVIVIVIVSTEWEGVIIIIIMVDETAGRVCWRVVGVMVGDVGCGCGIVGCVCVVNSGVSAELCVVVITIVGLGMMENDQSILWTYG